MGCSHLEIEKLKRTNDEELKQTRYVASTVTNDMLHNLFNTVSTDSAKVYDSLFGKEGALKQFKSVKDKTRSLAHFNSDNSPFGKKVGKMENGREVRYTAIALSHLLSVKDSEMHSVSKYGLKPSEILAVTNEDNGLINSSLSNMARTIGRDIMKSEGYRLYPKDKIGFDRAIEFETQVGLEAIEYLDKKGLVSIGRGSVIDRGFMKDDSSGNKFGNESSRVIDDVDTITLNDIYEPNPRKLEDVYETNRMISSKLSAVRKLILPVNVDIPSITPKAVRAEAQDINMPQEYQDSLEQIQKSGLRISTFVEEAIEQLKSEVDKADNKTTKNYLASIAKLVNEGSMSSPYLFGTIDSTELHNLMAEDAVGLEKEYGRSENKVVQFVRLLDDWEEIKGNPLHYSYQTASQNRAHTIEQTLNFQADKNFSRPILGSQVEQTITNEDSARYLVNFISDETGLSWDEIIGTEPNELLDTYISNLENTTSPLDTMIDWSTDMDKGQEYFLYPKAASVWEVYGYVQAIKDIRDGIKPDGSLEIKTNFIPKPDATASGAMNTNLQTVGRNANAEEVLRRLKDPTDDMSDMYELATTEIKALVKSIPEIEKTGHSRQKGKLKTAKLIRDIVNKAKVVPSERELIKLPFTTFIYGQSDYNNRMELSTTLADLIVSEGNDKAIKLILGSIPKDRGLIREELITELSKADGVSQTLVQIVSDTTGEALFNEQATILSNVHDLLEEARFGDNGYTQIQILPPMAAMSVNGDLNSLAQYSAAREEYGATIEKARETVVDSKDGRLTTAKKRFPNNNSIKVLLQHMVDAAIMHRAIANVLKRPEFKDYDAGMMLIHDSIAGTVEFAMALEEEYLKEIVKVNHDYDFVETAFQELRFARSKVEDGSKLAKKIDSMLNSEIASNIPKDIANKQAILGEQVIPNSFGLSEKVKKANAEKSFTKKVKESKTVPVAKAEPIEVSKKLKPLVDMDLIKTKLTLDTEYFANNLSGESQALITKAIKRNPKVNVVIGKSNDFNAKTNTITVLKDASEEVLVHEFIHAATATSIETDKNIRNKVQRIFDSVKANDPTLVRHLEGRYQGTTLLHEFFADSLSNPKMKDALSKQPGVLKNALKKLTRLAMHILGINTKSSAYSDLLSLLEDVKYAPRTSAVKLGFSDSLKDSYRKHEPLEIDTKNVLDFTSDTMVALDAKASRALQYTIDLSADTLANKLKGKTYHEKFMKEYPLYASAVNNVKGAWDDNTLISKLKIYLDLDKELDSDTMNLMQTQANNAETNKKKFEETKMRELSREMEGLYTKEEETTLYSVLSETPIYHLNEGATLHSIIDGSTTVKDAITETLATSKLSADMTKKYKEQAQALAKLYIKKEVTPGVLHTTANMDPTKEGTKLVNKLTALYSLDLIPDAEKVLHKSLESKKHTNLMKKLLELSSSIKVIDDELYGTIEYNSDNHSGNLNYMTFKGHTEVRTVTQANVNQKLKEEQGWKILRHPKKDSVGLIYRELSDPAYQSGISLGMQTDPNVQPLVYGKMTKAELEANQAIPMEHTNAAKLILSNDELTKIGAEKSVIASLVKAYSHKQMILETQSIRELVVDKFTYDYKKDGKGQLLKDIKANTHLWYIKLPKGTTIDMLDEPIRKKYKAASAHSDVDGFSDQVTLVRKDLADFIEGYKEIQIGAEGTTLNKAFNILKKSVLLQKIHWVIVNPAKIAMDATSNIAYLMSKNMPVTFLYKSYKEDSKLFHGFTQLREELIQAEFANRVNSTTATRRRIVKLEERIKNHELATAHYNGFVSSITVDLVGNNEHVATGMHKDINYLLNKLFKNSKTEELNLAGKAIMSISKFGINTEDLLIALANKTGKNAKESALVDSLEEIASHLKTIKEKDDVAAYLQEFMATPGSSLVGVGSMLNQMNDFVAKNALHKWLITSNSKQWQKANPGKKMSKEVLEKIQKDAVSEALTSFIDYKKNMPRELRILEQTGITSFVSFWARIQRVIFNSLRNNPVNAAFTIAINEMFNLTSVNILSADVFGRMSDGRIVGTPNLGLDVVLPTRLFN